VAAEMVRADVVGITHSAQIPIKLNLVLQILVEVVEVRHMVVTEVLAMAEAELSLFPI
jgi:hypothetical protein